MDQFFVGPEALATGTNCKHALRFLPGFFVAQVPEVLIVDDFWGDFFFCGIDASVIGSGSHVDLAVQMHCCYALLLN